MLSLDVVEKMLMVCAGQDEHALFLIGLDVAADPWHEYRGRECAQGMADLGASMPCARSGTAAVPEVVELGAGPEVDALAAGPEVVVLGAGEERLRSIGGVWSA